MKSVHIRRVFAVALAALLLVCAQPRSATRTWAASISIDDSGFSDPEKTQMTVYVWKEGVPPNDERHKMIEYPTLMTWDDKYFFYPGADFQRGCQEVLGYSSNRRYSEAHGWSTDNRYIGVENGTYHANEIYPHGAYWQNIGYTSGLLRNVDNLNTSLLMSAGTDTCFSLPEAILPKLIPLVTDDSYAIKIDLPTGVGFNPPHPDYSTLGWDARAFTANFTDWGGFCEGANYLTSARYNIYQVGEIFGIDSTQSNGFRWAPYAMNESIAINFDRWVNNDFNVFRFLEFSSMSDNDPRRAEYLAATVPWKIFKGKDGACAFWSRGIIIKDKDSRVTHSADDANQLEVMLQTPPMVSLSHYGDKFESRGDWSQDIVRNNVSYASNYGFRCFYADPTFFDFLQKSFTVESGQVTNLDGPLGITDKCTITVKDGGTLCVSGWVLNNGRIVVEEGGTLYVQDGACLNRYGDGGILGGEVITSGLVLVGKNAKLIGGGLDGLRFEDGSHAVNFGCIASENFYIANSHTIENRSGGFVVYGSGSGVVGSGSDTFSTPLDYARKTYAGRGKSVDTCYVYMPTDGVYDR